MKKLAIILAFVPMAQLWAIQGTVETTAGDVKTGDLKWQARQKSYLLTYKKGKTDVSAEFPVADVVRLDVPKPAALDKAIESVSKGQGGQAIPALSKIVTDYRMLVWDKVAGRYLCEAYVAAGQAPKAVEVCRGIIADDRKAEYLGELAPAYWGALIATGRIEQLEGLLSKAASSGDRVSSAWALVTRGNLIMTNGRESPDACKSALTDGYLRVVLMYQDDSCREARKAAMEKAANCLEKLGQNSQAEQMRAQAKGL